MPGRVLILSAGVGAGHHAAAEGLREELHRAAPEVHVSVHNGVGASRGPLRMLLERYLRWQLTYMPRAYSLSHAICVRWKPGRRLVMAGLYRGTHRRLGALIRQESPDVVVSTYPGVTAALGVMRERSELDMPVCAVVTDIAGLHFWAHTGVDVHLACYEESLLEISQITNGVPAIAARAPLARSHWQRRDRHGCRIALDLATDVPLIVISGGGWGIGDMQGAIAAALELGAVQVVAVCGHNARAARHLRNVYAHERRVRTLGYIDSMAELLGAASVLVHSTGGMTCLEAAAQGCPVIAYGFGFGHMRGNVAAMARFGVVTQARDRSELTLKLGEQIASSVSRRPSASERAPASTVILEVLERHRADGARACAAPDRLAPVAPDTQPASCEEAQVRLGHGTRLWHWLMPAALIAIWLLWRPASPDFAAQVYRVHLFAVDGFSLWDNNWYGGHYLPDYSLIFPPLAALLGLRWTGALTVTLSVLIFRRLVTERFATRTSIATTLFAIGAIGDLFIGRITFALGITLALASVLALVRKHRICSAVFSLACAAASPVAAAFLVLAATTELVTHRRPLRAAVLALPALGLTGSLALLFPESGYEPFSIASMAAAAAVSVALIIMLPKNERLLRNGAALYLVALLLSYFLHTPMGSNVVRFGVLFAPATLAGSVEVTELQNRLRRWRRQTSLLDDLEHGSRALAAWMMGLLGSAMVIWQIAGPLEQSVGASFDPASRGSFYAPAIDFLERHGNGRPMRIEVPFTSSHWDATILGERFDLARGWERQLDTRYDGLFYSNHLTASAYHAWLLETGVRYVVLSDAPMDFSSIQEAALIDRGLPFLRKVFSSSNWRIYAVIGAKSLASGPGELIAMDDDGFTLRAASSGTFLVRVRYTPYWRVSSGHGTVGRAPHGWTRVRASRRGEISIDAQFTPSI